MHDDFKVTLYSAPSCPYCRLTKVLLEQNGIVFQEFDVLRNQDARNDMVRLTGQMGVPVILIDGQVIIGFDEGALRRKLGI